ncbi:MAG: preprotein translocase subunit SecG [Candidatus Omnitrophica bacterium]|nr:preprotein translocase subunit SecG [Candidatus Omnitrophota bacterium]
MMILVIVLHALICVALIFIILMQSGRGGGLTEAFSSAESVFGARTNDVLVKGTGILAAIFLSACIGLAVMSSKKNQSLMTNVRPMKTINIPYPQPEAAPVPPNNPPAPVKK